MGGPPDQGARREKDVAPFMTGLKRVVPASYLAHVGEPRLFGARTVKILLPITPGMAWELRGVLTEAIQEHDLQICGVQPRITVEQSPQEAQVAQCMGRIMDACKNVVTNKALVGWTVEPDWRAKEINMSSAGSAGGAHHVKGDARRDAHLHSGRHPDSTGGRPAGIREGVCGGSSWPLGGRQPRSADGAVGFLQLAEETGSIQVCHEAYRRRDEASHLVFAGSQRFEGHPGAWLFFAPTRGGQRLGDCYT